MAGEALFIGWGPVARGREKQALALFEESMAYYTKLQDEGHIERFDVFLLSPHGGDLDGFILLHGERAKMARVRFSDEFERLIARASAILDSIGVVPAYGGDALAEQMGRFAEVAEELG
jgi:hypothetical protein